MNYSRKLVLALAFTVASGFAQFPGGIQIPSLGGRGSGGRNGGQQSGGQQPGGNGRGDGSRQVSPEEREKRQFDEFAKELDLSSSQKKKVKTILDDAHVSAESIQTEISDQRDIVLRAVRDGKSDEDIDKLSGEEGKAYARLAGVEATAFRRIFAVLDDSQRSRAEEVLGRSIGRFLTRPAVTAGGFGRMRAAE